AAVGGRGARAAVRDACRVARVLVEVRLERAGLAAAVGARGASGAWGDRLCAVEEVDETARKTELVLGAAVLRMVVAVLTRRLPDGLAAVVADRARVGRRGLAEIARRGAGTCVRASTVLVGRVYFRAGR